MKITLDEKQETIFLLSIGLLVVLVLIAVGQSALRQYQAQQLQENVMTIIEAQGSEERVIAALQDKKSQTWEALQPFLEQGEYLQNHPPILNIPIIPGAHSQSVPRLKKALCQYLLAKIADARREADADLFIALCTDVGDIDVDFYTPALRKT